LCFGNSTFFVLGKYVTPPRLNRSLDVEFTSGGPSLMRDTITNSGKLGLRLLEDLIALAAGGSVCANSLLIIALLDKDKISCQ
jgi:hypothetical protein